MLLKRININGLDTYILKIVAFTLYWGAILFQARNVQFIDTQFTYYITNQV